MLKRLVEYFVKNLVDNPSVVAVTERTDGNKTTVEVRVAAHDLKRVIGKEGRVVRTIRSIAQSLETQKTIEIALDSIS